MFCLCCSSVVTLPLFHVRCLSWDAILPELIPSGLLICWSSPSTAPWPILWALLHTDPQGWQILQPWAALDGSLFPARDLLLWGHPWAVPPSGLIHCCPMGSSMAICRDLFHTVSVGCRGMASPLCSSPALQGAATVCLEHRLHCPWCLKGCFSLISYSSPSCSCAAVFPFTTLPVHTQRCSWLSSHSGESRWSPWNGSALTRGSGLCS